MLRVVASTRRCRMGRTSTMLAAGLAALCLGPFGNGSTGSAPAQGMELRAARAQMVAIPGFTPNADRPRPCRPPTTLCGPTVTALEQGAFLDFRAGTEPKRAAPRLLSPFSVLRIEPLDAGRCGGRLCAAHVALAATLEELLRDGYYTHSVALFPGSAVVTLRTERIDRAMKALKGSCRFNLDAACVDLDGWLQQDLRSGEPCGLAQTRVLVASPTAPEFVGAATFISAGSTPDAGLDALRSVALEAATTKVYELVYVHKICRSGMSLVRNG